MKIPTIKEIVSLVCVMAGVLLVVDGTLSSIIWIFYKIGSAVDYLSLVIIGLINLVIAKHLSESGVIK